MSKDKQYRAKLKSKHNNEIMWTGEYYNTFKGAQNNANRQRLKEKFENEYYTEIEVLLIEEMIVTKEVTETGNNKICPTMSVGEIWCYCNRERCAWWLKDANRCSQVIEAQIATARYNRE